MKIKLPEKIDFKVVIIISFAALMFLIGFGCASPDVYVYIVWIGIIIAFMYAGIKLTRDLIETVRSYDGSGWRRINGNDLFFFTIGIILICLAGRMVGVMFGIY